MKLSQAIEAMLIGGFYNPSAEFMCHVLQRAGHEEHVEAVQDMVHVVWPSSRRGYPLSCAVHDAEVYTYDDHSNLEMFLFCQQLYCWWVFDLKRKGL